MSHIPTGTIMAMLLLDLLVVLAASLAAGLVVASAAGSSRAKGAAVGLLLPGVGPTIWAIVVAARGRAGVTRSTSRGPGQLLAAAVWSLAAVLLLLGLVARWGELSGGYEKSVLALDASAGDTPVGLLATLLSSLALLGGAGAVLVWSSWRRISLVLLGLASAWLLVSMDSLIVLSAIDGLEDEVSGVTAGRGTVHAAAGAGLWLALVASVLVLAGVALLGLLPRSADEPVPALAGIRAGWSPPTSQPVLVAEPPRSPGQSDEWGGPDPWGVNGEGGAGSTPASESPTRKEGYW